ncbi:hypothetical protein E2C01_065841 [Portunus trituberculatus]|uniref:Uncharacterized protein n=1 Tax=Portunus trituberculatus TaxID=210409 RepID=A0A5B7HN73_PORTR|nr:hypothetical protein [Portunus trituberculatus]
MVCGAWPGVGVASAVSAVRTCGGVWGASQSLHGVLGARLWLANGKGFGAAWLGERGTFHKAGRCNALWFA